MAPIEHTQEAARGLTRGVVTKYYEGILQKIFPNPLRAMEDCAKEMTAVLKANKFPETFYPLVATIGDVSTIGFNRMMKTGEADEILSHSLETGDEIDLKLFTNDPFETEFATIANDLGLDPNKKFSKKPSKFSQTLQKFGNIFRDAWKRGGVSLHRYETSGRGSSQSRTIFAEQAKSLGIDVDQDDVWLTEGGMGALNRMGISLNSYYEKNYGRKARFLAPTPTFTMTAAAQDELGLETAFVDAQQLPNQELDGPALDNYFRQQEEMANMYGGKSDYIPDILYLIPADNPTARSVDPERLRGVIEVARSRNPDMVFFFDMAYMKLIPAKKAEAIINVIKETGAIDHSIFAFSDSKRLGQPGSRFGAIIVPKGAHIKDASDSKKMKMLGTGEGLIQNTTRKINPGWSVETDVMYQAINKLVGDEHVEGYKRLLRQRQTALLEVLKDLDPSGRYFRNLDRIHIPLNENEAPPEGSVVQDVPLYLWVEINNDNGDFLRKCFDIIEDLNIVGVPGTVFKDGGHMRFSLGVVSTLDILKKSDTVMRRWLEMSN